MIEADLHSHTSISHGTASLGEMYEAARRRGLRYFGFSEHSPLPDGFFCHLYTGDLKGGFDAYARGVLDLKNNGAENPIPLLGLELDWLPSRLEWMRKLVHSQPFDYVLGSLHYLDGYSVGNLRNWGPDVGRQERFGRFEAYFCEMASLAKSGLAQIAAHPDFIKLRAWDDFQAWLEKPESEDYICLALNALADNGMAMEVNSAGLRQDFKEPYPCPAIMRLAGEINLPISFGSDAHNLGDIARDFDFLADYSKSFGYGKSLIFIEGNPLRLKF